MHDPRNRRWTEFESDGDLELESARPRILGRTLTNVLVLAGLCLAIAWTFGRFEGGPSIDPNRSPAGVREPARTLAIVPERRSESHVTSYGGTGLTVPPDARGHFLLSAAVDGVQTRFLVDSGASVVVLSADDAYDVGLQPEVLDYTLRLSTANGEIAAAPVVLREIVIGDLRVADVEAVVVRSPLEVSLLGASFLSRLEGYEVTPAGLTLRW